MCAHLRGTIDALLLDGNKRRTATASAPYPFHPMVKRFPVRVLVVTAVAVLGVGGCTDSDSGSDDEGGDEADAPTTTSTSIVNGPSVSFTDVAAPAVDLGGGWSAKHCEGEAPIICVSRDGEAAGLVELATFPVDSFDLPGFQDAVADGDVEEALTILAADFVSVFEVDRTDACGTDYELEGTTPEPATVLGRAGMRYGYVGTDGGRLVERQVNHGTIIGDEVVLVNASAYAPDGCVPPEGEFDPDTLDDFTPRLRALVAAATR
jgi:hypothetical protein